MAGVGQLGEWPMPEITLSGEPYTPPGMDHIINLHISLYF
jgi:hypothetical protein